MKISIARKLGDSLLTFEIEGKDEKDALEKASKFTDSGRSGNLPERCGFCSGKNIMLTSYRTKEKNFLYVKIRCKDCDAYSELGTNTQGAIDVFYWKKWEKYDKVAGKTIQKAPPFGKPIPQPTKQYSQIKNPTMVRDVPEDEDYPLPEE